MRFGKDAGVAIVKSDGDFKMCRTPHSLFDFVAGIGPTDGTDDGTQNLALSTANLIAEQSAHDATANRAESGAVTILFDFTHALDRGAVAAGV